jgi:hypothetical protein
LPLSLACRLFLTKQHLFPCMSLKNWQPTSHLN